MDYQKRSALKAVTWRVLATLTTMAAVFIITGKLSISLGVGALDVAAKLVIYYVHERIWNNVKWGRR